MRHIAEAKRKENIVEYLLYMWQMEDLLRGVEFDLMALEERFLNALESEQQQREAMAWFSLLIRDMKSAKAETSGHSAESYELISELNLLQNTLITVIDDEAFKKIFTEVQPVLQEFRAKTDKLPKSDVETALTAMYGYLTLRLAAKEISPETQAALNLFGKYLGYLAKAYRDMKSGKLPLNN